MFHQEASVETIKLIFFNVNYLYSVNFYSIKNRYMIPLIWNNILQREQRVY